MQRFRLWRTPQNCGKQFRPKGATKGKRLKEEEFRGVEKDMHRSRRKGSSVEKPYLPKANPEGRKPSHCVIFGGEVSTVFHVEHAHQERNPVFTWNICLEYDGGAVNQALIL